MTKRETVFSKDTENGKLTVVRSFDAPLEQVWEAWTKSEILDKWWAPKPYHVETKTMDFREGGMWLYCMVGCADEMEQLRKTPEEFRMWSKESYKKIDLHKMIINACAFCDEAGNENQDFSTSNWKKEFSQTGNDTTVKVEITFDKKADLERFMNMGFKEGFTAGLSNLDDYLSTLGSK